MNWLKIAQEEQLQADASLKELQNELILHFRDRSRFCFAHDHYSIWEVRTHMHSSPELQAVRISNLTNSVIGSSNAKASKLETIPWIASQIMSRVHRLQEDQNPEAVSQFERYNSILIGTREYTFWNHKVASRFRICFYPENTGAMSLSKGPSQVHSRDVVLVKDLEFSRLQDLKIFLTSNQFREEVHPNTPDHFLIKMKNLSLLNMVRTAANMHDLLGTVITGHSLLELIKTKENSTSDMIMDFKFEDFENLAIDLASDDVFLMTFPQNEATLNKVIGTLKPILKTYFPAYRIDTINMPSSLLMRVSQTPIKQNPVETINLEPKFDFDFVVGDSPESDFINTFASKKKVISFDYDDTTVFHDYPSDNEDGEPISKINPEAAALMKFYASQGYKIIIVTCRTPDTIGDIWGTIEDENLPVSEVYATSHTSKAPILAETGASIHYDNDLFRLQEITDALGTKIKVYRETEMSNHLKNMI